MKIKTYGDCGALLVWDWRDIALTTADFEALRAFFLAERDQDLGWWRDPEEPYWVASPYDRNANAAIVYNERTRFTCFWQRRAAETSSGTSSAVRVAKRYFAAHPQPEPEPKPWLEAEHEEIWVITANGDTGPALATTSHRRGTDLAFQTANGTLLDVTEITAGRRIWPEPRIGGAE